MDLMLGALIVLESLPWYDVSRRRYCFYDLLLRRSLYYLPFRVIIVNITGYFCCFIPNSVCNYFVEMEVQSILIYKKNMIKICAKNICSRII